MSYHIFKRGSLYKIVRFLSGKKVTCNVTDSDGHVIVFGSENKAKEYLKELQEKEALEGFDEWTQI